MKKISFFFLPLFVLAFSLTSCTNSNMKKEKYEQDIENLLSQMTLEEKVKMLGGEGFETPGIERLGIPGLKMTDGPAGVRWGRSTAFPGPVSLAASWDKDLVFRVGQAMAEEVKLKNKNVLLAPCVNIHRFPLGGRNFESYGEDPFLAGQTDVAFIKGVQDRNVVATVKHYAANNQEWERHIVDIRVSERALREIYLPAFKAAVQEAGVYSVMAAYNKVNGHYCSENKHLLTDILKNEWGFKGYVVSDWGATHSTVRAANAGLDIEMPFGKHFGDSLITAVKEGKVSEQTVDDKVKRILRVMYEAKLMDTAKKPHVDSKQLFQLHWKLALEAAEKGIVLLKNEGSLLPLDKKKIKTIAVVGPNAAYAISGGGGSSQVQLFYKVSPLEGIRQFVGEDVKILYASGPAMDGDIFPIEPQFLLMPNKKTPGLKGEYYQSIDFSGKPVFTRTDKQIIFNFAYDAPRYEMNAVDDGNRYAIRWTGYLKAPVTGTYEMLFQSDGGARLYVDGKKLIDDSDNEKPVKLRTAKIYLKKGQLVPLKMEYVAWYSISEVKLGWNIPGFGPVKEAVEVAKKADVVVLVTGLSNHFESESGDLERFVFPEQDKFINAIAKANPNTVVVMYNGSPYSVTAWVDHVPAVVEGWYGGQEQGNALANVLFGKVNPSGKLPYSLIRDSVDCPAFKGYKDPGLVGNYSEGIFVGYRYLDKNNIDPVFPFGHGLSYTTFKYSNLKTKLTEDKKVRVTLTVENTGKRNGWETVQIYVQEKHSKVPRPMKELKAFHHVNLDPGIKAKVVITLDRSAFAYYDKNQSKWVVEPGEYVIMAGSSSRDIRLKQAVDIHDWSAD